MPEEGNVIPVKVALRCRPLIPKETDEGCQTCLSFVEGEPQVILGSNKSFTYDFVFNADTPQNEVYDKSVAPLVNGIFKGYNATVLAYGQTGSGKTFSMGGGYGVSIDTDESIVGVIPRVIRSLFDGITERELEYSFIVKVSYIEIYKEELLDLLLPVEKRDKDTVTIREDNNGIRIVGLSEFVVKNVEDTMQCLETGSYSRTTGSTAMNTSSSRSHAIFTIHIERTNKNDSQDFCSCKFHLVDLAGSERQKKTHAEGERLKEGININMGLLALGNVISALGDESQRSKHVPYRDSKLTRLLQDSLGGNSHTVMIACVSPADSNMEETISTLRYADRARKIKNKPVINRDPQVAEILRLRHLVGDLQSQLLSNGGTLKIKQDVGGHSYQDSQDLKAIRQKNIELMDKNRSLEQQLEQAWEQNEQHCTRIIVLETRKDALQEKLDLLKEKLVHLNENTPEDAVVADVIKDMIKDLMGQIDDIEKTQNENFESYLQSINDESQEGSFNSDNEQTQNKSDEQEIEKPKTDAEKFSEEMKEKFNERRAQLSKDLGDLNKKLLLKQSRAEDMKMSSEMYDQIKEEYEDSIKNLNGQIGNLQSEKEQLEVQLHEKKAATNAAKVNETRRKRIVELEGEVAKKKKEILDAKKMIKMKEQTVKDSEKLGHEIQSLKVQRVQLMKQMKTDGNAFRKFKQQKDQEVLQLKAKERKRQVEITKLERKNSQQQNILKRKNEETNALTRRLNEALMKQKKVLEERVRKEETQVSIGKGANVKKTLGHELEIMVGLLEAKEHKEELVKDRADINKQLSKLRRELENYGPANKKQMLNNSSEKEKDEEKQRIEKERREFENHLALKNSNINDLSSKILELEGDANEKLKRSRFQDIKTLVDARIGFNYLLQAASASKVECRKNKRENYSLKEGAEELSKELSTQVESLEKKLEKQRNAYEEKLEEIQQIHENKTLFMLKQMQNRSSQVSDGVSSSASNDNKVQIRLKFQEEEINKLSHFKEDIEQKDEYISNLKKELTKLTYNSRCMSTSLMPDFNSGPESGTNTPNHIASKASFFSSAVLQTPAPTVKPVRPTKPSITTSVASHGTLNDDADFEDWEEEDLEDDYDSPSTDEEWEKGFTPYAFNRAKRDVAKKQYTTKPPPLVNLTPGNTSGEMDPKTSSEMCGCKGSCKNKLCKCRKLKSYCDEKCDCSSEKCCNREIQLPESTTNEDDSHSNMNVTFVKDTSSTLENTSDILKDSLNRQDHSSKNKRSLETSSDDSTLATKYRKSGDAVRESTLRRSDSRRTLDGTENPGLVPDLKPKRKLGTKKSSYFTPPQ